MNSVSNNTKIGVNTIYLYAQKGVTIIVALYASRVLLKCLGIDEFGLYGLVGSIVVMFNSLRGLFSSSIQRFINVSKGYNDSNEVSKIFSMGLNIHIVVGIILAILLEIVGFILIPRLEIANGNYNAAYWILQWSILSTVFSLLTVPFDALIIANEKFSAYATFSLIDAFLRVGVIWIVPFLPYNRAASYAFLLFMVSLIIRLISAHYCKRKFPEESKYGKSWDRQLFRRMGSFAGWNLCGNIGYSLSNEGVNIILNHFGGVVVNAARTITYQVYGAVRQFTNDVTLSLQPQSMQIYIKQNYEKYMRLQIMGSKVSYGMTCIILFPILCFPDFILVLWLGQIPNYTVNFIYAISPYLLLRSLHPFIDITFKTVGRLREYQIIELSCMLVTLPLSYVCLQNKLPFYFVFVAMSFMEGMNLFLILYLVRKQTEFDSRYFSCKLFPRIILYSFLLLGCIVFIKKWFVEIDVFMKFVIILIFEIIACIVTSKLLFDKREMNSLYGIVKDLTKKLK